MLASHAHTGMHTEKQAFSTLINDIHNAALRYSKSLCGSNDQGEEILQIASIIAWNKFSSLRDRGRFRPWFFKIIKRSYLSYRRTQMRRSTIAPICELDEENIASFDPAIRSMDSSLQHAFTTIDPERLSEWLLYVLGGYRVKELSEIQRCSRSCLEKRLERTRKKLHNALLRNAGNASAGAVASDIVEQVSMLATQADRLLERPHDVDRDHD